nr:auxilin-like protein [Tanacetum cinerariifolium]
MKLNERIKSLSGNLKEEKIKRELDEIETINIELDHRVTKLVAENEHLKQTYNLQENVLVITALKDTLSKLKGKAVVNEAVTLHPIDPELLKIDVAALAPKLQNNRTAHYDYLKHTQKETATLREIVENQRLLNPLNTSLDYACIKLMAMTPVNKNKKIRVTEHITSSGNTPIITTSSSNVVCNKRMLSFTRVNLLSASGSQPPGNTKKDRTHQTQRRTKKNKLEDNPRNVRTSLHNKKSVVNAKDIASVPNSKLNVNMLTSASGSQPQGNTKKDRIQQTQSRAKKNKLEEHPRNVRPCLHNKKSVVNTEAISSVTNSKLNVNSDLKCATCNGCLFSDNHDSCVLEFINSMNARVKSKSSKKPVNKKIWKPTGKCLRLLDINGDLHEGLLHYSGPALNEMTPATISSGLAQKPSSLTPYVPPSRNDWDLLFQPLFDELLTPPPSVDPQAPEVITPIGDVIPLVQAESTSSPSSTTVDQDAPSPKVTSDKSSSTVSPHTIGQPDHQIPQQNSKWTKDHPLDNIIGQLSRPVSTRVENGFVAGQAALKAESSKVAKHEKPCLENQHVFIPFAFDTFGFLAPETEKLLNRVQ